MPTILPFSWFCLLFQITGDSSFKFQFDLWGSMDAAGRESPFSDTDEASRVLQEARDRCDGVLAARWLIVSTWQVEVFQYYS